MCSVGIKYQDGVKKEHTVVTIRAWSELLGCRAKELGSEENRVPWRPPQGFRQVWSAVCLNNHRDHELMPAHGDTCKHVWTHTLYSDIYCVTYWDTSKGDLEQREGETITTPSSPKKKLNPLCSSLQGAERRESSCMPRIYIIPKKDQEIQILELFRLYILKTKSPT